MRAKRSKKYRKLMHQYELTFGFREPYQVLVDSNFLQAVYTFKMDLIPALERTLQGKAKPFLTKCSLAAVMASSPTQTTHYGRQMRPPQLPPPTVLPLRYCSHNEDSTPIDEAACLLSLLSPSEGAKKNKEHYILASADPPTPPESTDKSQNRRGSQARPPPQPQQRYNLRRDARLIPGVPIIYVKRSVMILEPLSGTSEGIREGVERGKFRTGFASPAVTGKRKRGAEGDGDAAAAKSGSSKKPKGQKGPNPLSMLKAKKKDKQPAERKSEEEGVAAQKEKPVQDPEAAEGEDSAPKTKRKRKHKRHKTEGEEVSAETIPVPSES